MSEKPTPMDFEQYACLQGTSRSDLGDAGLHKRRRGESDKSWARKVARQSAQDSDWLARRNRLREQYAQAVARGELRPLTPDERTERIASGHPDNPSVQAARRLLEKRGGQISGS